MSDRDRNPEGEKPEALSAEHESPGRRHRPTLGTLPPDVLALLTKFAAIFRDYETFGMWTGLGDDTKLLGLIGQRDEAHPYFTIGDARELSRIVESYTPAQSGEQP